MKVTIIKIKMSCGGLHSGRGVGQEQIFDFNFWHPGTTVCPKEDVTFDFARVSFIFILTGCDCIYLFTKIVQYSIKHYKTTKV